jgi:hypothetical protein
MADMIKCPVCGESNPKEFEFCQYCQSRLQPLTGPLKGADAPIKPGSAPTKKSTADLEPILPQWLRDARSSARDASEGDLPQTPQQSKLSPRPSPSASSASQDLLAGLSAQSDDDDEETPDWLANITGGAPTSKKPKGESADVRWVELGGAKDSAPESETPSWMQELTPLEPQSGQQSGLNDWMREASGASQQPADESPDWLRQMAAGDGGKLFDDSTDTFTPADSSDTPDWLRQMRAADSNSQNDVTLPDLPANTFNAAPADESPDWLRSLGAADSSTQNNSAPDWLNSLDSQSKTVPDAPDWLSSLGAADSGVQGDDALFGNAAPDAPDWLRSLDANAGATSNVAPAQSSDTPDWLSSLGAADSVAQNNDAMFGNATPAASDTPDWMRSLDTPSAATPAQSSDTPDWLSSLGAADSGAQNNDAMFGSATPAASDTPDWMRSLDTPSAATPAQSSDTPDWLSSLGAVDSGAQNNEALFGSATPTASDTPDWMRSLDTPSAATSAQSSDTPDWLSSLGAADSGAQNDDAMFDSVAPTASDTPDWMRSLETPSAATSAQSSDTPDWLSSLGAADSVAQNNDAMFGSATPAASDTPDWLQGLGSETPSATPTPAVNDDWLKGAQGGASQPAQSDQLSEADMPSWLAGASTPASLPPAAEPQKDTESAALGDVPSWLKAAAPQSSIYDDLRAPQPAAPVAPSDSSSSGWTSAFKSLDPALPAQSEPAAAFTADSSGSADSLFTDMPDWLSGAVETPALSAAPETKPAEDTIEASQLPSWVQAMRPVDTGVAQIAATSGRSQTLEARGAFAGLQGALPAAPSYAPTSKPKTYSLKLQATGEQLSQAALLEQILAAETSPVPIASFSTLRTSNILRWSLAFIFFAMAFAVLSMRTQIFSLPVGVPFEIDTAIQAVQFIPEDAPVLVAFDYEPARVGEMEAVAGPLFDNLTLFHRPRLTFIATNENSSLLADRFMLTGPMAAHTKNGLQYLNLGYLPGGQMGIRAFAQNPRAAAPFDVTFAPAWDSVQLQDVKSFSQFAAFILVTDSSDAARVWIEQTTSVRGTVPIVVIASAQAAPMIQPYYASGQIKGLVSGLQGGAVFEQSNAGRPGTARAYWDAYSIGMLIAAALIVFGGLWNLFLSSRDRAAAREVK